VPQTLSRLAPGGLATLILIDTIGGVAVRNVIGWPAFIVVSTLLTAAAVWMLIRIKPAALTWHNLPKSLLAFLTLATISIAWSSYRFESLLGVLILLATTTVALFIAFVLTWNQFLKSLATTLKILLLGSVLFELFISVFIRVPVYIWWVDAPAPGEKPLKLLMWSRDQLFEGGPVQGLFGNSTLLGFTALLGLIVFAVQLVSKNTAPVRGWFWVALSVALIAMTRSATVTVALIVVAIALAFALWARRLGETESGYRSRTPLYATATAFLLAGLALVLFARDWLFSLLGKGSDLTGRLETWQKVAELAEQRSAFGWGWISYWAPWVEPFKSLDTKNGIQVMHAHNAWLDVWLQLGVIGLILFALIVVSTFWRTWFLATDRPRRFVNETLPFTPSTLVPFLIIVALIVQSLTESRTLIEGGWVMLTVFAEITKHSPKRRLPT
jgi:exopolysaccharide production protein ExoQ